MATKHPSQQSDRRVNISLKAHEVDLLKEVGEALHNAGIPGMLDDDGKPNNSAIVRRLLHEKERELRRRTD